MDGRMRLAVAALAAALIHIAPALAAAVDRPSCLRATATGDGDTLTLSMPVEGTAAVRLAGIVAPLPPAEAPADKPWPAAIAARDGLAALIADHCLSLIPDAPIIDRYNRMYAHIYRDDGVWIQGELVKRGLVLVLPGLDAPERVRRLLPLEAAARAAHQGIWAGGDYAVRSPDEADRYVGTLQLVEGAVRKATRVGPQVYLNFGEDWRSDFTIVIPAKALAAWTRAGIDPLQLGGKRVRVRGVVEMLNGPMIEAPQPEVLEVLGEDG